jgi:hypothetical protein
MQKSDLFFESVVLHSDILLFASQVVNEDSSAVL